MEEEKLNPDEELAKTIQQKESDRFTSGQEREYTSWRDTMDGMMSEKENLYKANPNAAELKRKEAVLKNFVSALGTIADGITVSRGGTVPVRDFRNEVYSSQAQADNIDEREKLLEQKSYQAWLDKIANLQGKMPKTTTDLAALKNAEALFRKSAQQRQLKNAFDIAEMRERGADKRADNKIKSAEKIAAARERGANYRSFIRVNYGKKDYVYQTEIDGITYSMPKSQAHNIVEAVKRDINSGKIKIPTVSKGNIWSRTTSQDQNSLEYRARNRSLSDNEISGIVSQYWDKYYDVDPRNGTFIHKSQQPVQNEEVFENQPINSTWVNHSYNRTTPAWFQGLIDQPSDIDSGFMPAEESQTQEPMQPINAYPTNDNKFKKDF